MMRFFNSRLSELSFQCGRASLLNIIVNLPFVSYKLNQLPDNFILLTINILALLFALAAVWFGTKAWDALHSDARLQGFSGNTVEFNPKESQRARLGVFLGAIGLLIAISSIIKLLHVLDIDKREFSLIDTIFMLAIILFMRRRFPK
jgi:hypothetical protein